ncbi:ATP-grasp domain-containing protein [Clostridium sp.]|uniref:ATP-grasp domain-containing protein n=1 Tax=Clostridium sp. TaxID=1506 RepID=UPI0026088BAF|nr:ATP-grasp domain-containing protein [Clostridium sp.]
MRKKRILVYPCGTEIGLEVYRSLNNSTYFEIIGGSSTYDHGRFVYKKHIDKLPFITDNSSEKEIEKLNEFIEKYHIDYVYPAMDGVIYNLSKYRSILKCKLVAPNFETVKITRSKLLTYELLKDIIKVPVIYNLDECKKRLPIFIKPDIGQGSVGAYKIQTEEELDYYARKADKKIIFMEYLPGEEYTIDCFTNKNGELIYASGRGRKRIKGGISVNAIKIENTLFMKIAKKINEKLNQYGGWFFQLKQNESGELVLLEVASRIAGGSSYSRCLGVNLPMLTMFEYEGNLIDSVMINKCDLEMDRALYNSYKIDISYENVYIDYDDTLIINGKINTQLISFLYDCINKKVKIFLITKHKGDITNDLCEKKLNGIFDKVILLKDTDKKHDYITSKNSIFIDDSYGERYDVFKEKGIPTFDTHMIECLINN